MTLSSLCKKAGITKVELADVLGYKTSTVYRWGTVAPRHVIAYLECLIELNRYRP